MSSERWFAELVFCPNILRGSPRLTNANVGPMTELSSDFRALFNAQFEAPLSPPDTHQKSRYTTVAYDPLATVRLGSQALNVAVGELADSGS